MDKIETTGRTVDEALQAAARELGVSVDAVDYEIVEEGTKGFLGLGQSPTLVRAWIREGAGEPSEAPEVAAEPVQAAEVEEAELEAPEEPEKPQPARRKKAAAPVEPAAEEPLADLVMSLVEEILSATELEIKSALKSETDEEIVVELAGTDVAILIGKHGQTLDALQYLVSIAATKQQPSRKRVILDAEGYRDRHREMLERKAHEYARAVKAQGQEAVLEPQSARDRRVVHLALADDPDVYTYSEGEGGERHVVISPRK